jgi:hypothetical protein
MSPGLTSASVSEKTTMEAIRMKRAWKIPESIQGGAFRTQIGVRSSPLDLSSAMVHLLPSGLPFYSK